MKKGDFICTLHQLKKYLREKNWDVSRIRFPNIETKDYKNFPVLIPKYYLNLINWYDIDDPIRKMVVPCFAEAKRGNYELDDPIGDKTHSPLPGIVRRYRDRCLLMTTNNCAVHCRFCLRRNILSKEVIDLPVCFNYINEHSEIWEVILSGGDPLALSDLKLHRIIKELRKISHIKTIRLHTRTPVVHPKRITDEFCKIFTGKFSFSIVLHINHPREIASNFKEAVLKLRQKGILLLSQTVLLKDVNNDLRTLETLFRSLVELGIKPYYLHHLDFAAGTSHFRISIEEGKSLIKKLQNRISGLCLPQYVVDLPGSLGKVPVQLLKYKDYNKYEAENFNGDKIMYLDPAATKLRK